MGNPRNYSLELPQRCLQLLDELWPHAEKINDATNPILGPLTPTFLISMSMPIINIPLERIERRNREEGQEYASDRAMNANTLKSLNKFMGKPFSQAPFYRDGAWRHSSITKAPFSNVSAGVTDEIAESFDSDLATLRASRLTTSKWLSVIRNALAHGGIAYLDETGRSSYDQPVSMFLFASGDYDRTRQLEPKQPPPLIGVNYLRIKQTSYREFLRLWVDWLRKTGIYQNQEAA